MDEIRNRSFVGVVWAGAIAVVLIVVAILAARVPLDELLPEAIGKPVNEWRVRRSGYVEAFTSTTESYIHSEELRGHFSLAMGIKRDLLAHFAAIPGLSIRAAGTDPAEVFGGQGKITGACVGRCLQRQTEKAVSVRASGGRMLDVSSWIDIHTLSNRNTRIALVLGDCVFLHFGADGEYRSGPRFSKGATVVLCEANGAITPDAILRPDRHLEATNTPFEPDKNDKRTASEKFDALRAYLVAPYYPCTNDAFRHSSAGEICNAQIPVALTPR